jgi:hypothetical protein
MASPHVAAVAAMLKAYRPGISPDEVESAIEGSAVDLGMPGRDDDFGYGRIDAAAALAAVAPATIAATEDGATQTAETPTEDAPTQTAETPTEDAPTQTANSPAEETPTQTGPTEQAPAEETPTRAGPADQAPAADAPSSAPPSEPPSAIDSHS